jgi:hypothetical protein
MQPLNSNSSPPQFGWTWRRTKTHPNFYECNEQPGTYARTPDQPDPQGRPITPVGERSADIAVFEKISEPGMYSRPGTNMTEAQISNLTKRWAQISNLFKRRS